MDDNLIEIVKYLRENGSKNVQTRMSETNGEEFCASYIQAQIDEYKVTKEVALGWLEQDLSEMYNN